MIVIPLDHEQVWGNGAEFRRVVLLYTSWSDKLQARRNYVVYSIGRPKNRSCLETTFRRWAARVAADLVVPDAHRAAA